MIMLQAGEHSPNFAELRVSYKRKPPRKTFGTQSAPLSNPWTCEDYLRKIWDKNTIELREEFIVLYLNASHAVLGWTKIATGGISHVFIDPRLVFGIAVQVAASAIIVAHNHPTGNLSPSPDDRATTNKLKQAGEILGIRLLDHLIITKDQFYSFARHEEGFR